MQVFSQKDLRSDRKLLSTTRQMLILTSRLTSCGVSRADEIQNVMHISQTGIGEEKGYPAN